MKVVRFTSRTLQLQLSRFAAINVSRMKRHIGGSTYAEKLPNPRLVLTNPDAAKGAFVPLLAFRGLQHSRTFGGQRHRRRPNGQQMGTIVDMSSSMPALFEHTLQQRPRGRR